MTSVPELMPTLSRGKHRSPRRGACFMEMASYLAGERWSDHPSCTHPLLAAVARLVNDSTGDAERQELAPMIPTVIGLHSEDPHWDIIIASRAAAVALPFAAESRQRALAVGLLACERRLDELDDRPADTLSPDTREALERVPQAWAWARRFVAGHDRLPLQEFRRRSAPSIVLTAVAGLREACTSDVAGKLRALLASVIAECAAQRARREPVGATAAGPLSLPV